jgi:fucose 4-O-acetylase-like acetyltransferase
MLTIPASATRAAAATPAGRDRYVDFLRVASLAVVVLGHWLMAVVVVADGRLRATNVLEVTPWARWLTWVFQIMPLFFVVGGFSNAASLAAARRDGLAYGMWLRSRLMRLIRPVLAFAVVWTAAAALVRMAGGDPGALRAGSIAQPLWFLAVYLAVVALAPAMVRAYRRWGGASLVALAAAVAVGDLLRWGVNVPVAGWANLATVWLFAHQLGVAWREGRVAAWSRARLVAVAVGALAALVVLCGWLGYPLSMVGGAGEARSNTFPPSLALVAVAVWQFGAVLGLRPVADRWLARPRVWAAVIAANGMAMTVYLWHLTALVVVAAAGLATGWLPQPEAGSAAWWAWRPVWVALLAAALVPLVAAFGRFEARRVVPSADDVPTRRAAAAAGLAAAGMAMLARRGFTVAGMPLGLPLVPLALVGLSWWLLGMRAADSVCRSRRNPTRSAQRVSDPRLQ